MNFNILRSDISEFADHHIAMGPDDPSLRYLVAKEEGIKISFGVVEKINQDISNYACDTLKKMKEAMGKTSSEEELALIACLATYVVEEYESVNANRTFFQTVVNAVCVFFGFRESQDTIEMELVKILVAEHEKALNLPKVTVKAKSDQNQKDIDEFVRQLPSKDKWLVIEHTLPLIEGVSENLKSIFDTLLEFLKFGDANDIKEAIEYWLPLIPKIENDENGAVRSAILGLLLNTLPWIKHYPEKERMEMVELVFIPMLEQHYVKFEVHEFFDTLEQHPLSERKELFGLMLKLMANIVDTDEEAKYIDIPQGVRNLNPIDKRIEILSYALPLLEKIKSSFSLKQVLDNLGRIPLDQRKEIVELLLPVCHSQGKNLEYLIYEFSRNTSQDRRKRLLDLARPLMDQVEDYFDKAQIFALIRGASPKKRETLIEAALPLFKTVKADKDKIELLKSIQSKI